MAKIKLSQLKPNKKNPRKISEAKLAKLQESIEGFKKMMTIRKIVIDEKGIILAGNQRYQALKALGYKEIPSTWVHKVSNLSEEEKKEFMLKDNDHGGDWDAQMFDNKFWKDEEVNDWMGEEFLQGLPIVPQEKKGGKTQKKVAFSASTTTVKLKYSEAKYKKVVAALATISEDQGDALWQLLKDKKLVR